MWNRIGGKEMSASKNNVEIGMEIPILTKTAYNPIEEDARNPIHTDNYAKKFGMRGALVGGSTLLSYVLEMLYDYFGQNWLTLGRIKVNFIGGGAINGDVVTAHGTIRQKEAQENGTQVTLDVWLENQKNEKIVVGEAICIK
jgi:acyl dehydratase